jgi:hypothetical protein
VLHRRRQARPALAGVLLFGAYLASLALAGFGTRSLFYATPWSDPARYLWNLLTMVSGGVLALLGPVPLDLVTLFPSVQLVLCVAGIALGWPLAAWILRRVPRGQRLLPALWTLLFVAPQGGVLPADRLLFVPAVGAAALLALAWSAERARWAELSRVAAPRSGRSRSSVTLGSGLYLLAQNSDVLPGMATHVRAKALASDVGPPALGLRDVVVLQTESAMQAFTLAVTWRAETRDADVRFWVLQSGPRAVRWTRTRRARLRARDAGPAAPRRPVRARLPVGRARAGRRYALDDAALHGRGPALGRRGPAPHPRVVRAPARRPRAALRAPGRGRAHRARAARARRHARDPGGGAYAALRAVSAALHCPAPTCPAPTCPAPTHSACWRARSPRRATRNGGRPCSVPTQRSHFW